MPCRHALWRWDLLPGWGVLSRKQASGAWALFSLSSLCLGSTLGSSYPDRDGPAASRSKGMAAALLGALTTTTPSLTGLPTPGCEGEWDSKLKIAAVLFLCWRGGAGRGAPATLNDLPTKNKASSLHSLCFCRPGLPSSLRWSLNGVPTGRARDSPDTVD